MLTHLTQSSEPEEGTQTLKLASDAEPAPSWTSSIHPVELINHSDPLPPHIFPGSMCNHGEALAFNGRPRPAYSLSEVALHTLSGDRESIIVAMTRFAANETTTQDAVVQQEAARREVESFCANHRIFAVKRGEGQCIYCAWRLAWASAALVIIV